MDTLQMLGVALGLASLAGINLYLTVFLSGLAINAGWITLAPQYAKLALLGDPAIMTVAGVLFAVEFFADKIPWVDTAWDTVHTLIRPAGGALLSLQVLGTSNPAFDVIIALLGGSVSLGTHGIKAGTRLMVNTSPEPFSNIALSLTEDVAVVGGLALTAFHPALMFCAVVITGAFALWLLPRIFGFFAVRFAFLWNKMHALGDDDIDPLASQIPAEADIRLAAAREEAELGNPPTLWALPCYTEARVGGCPRHTRGWLVAQKEAGARVAFVPRKRSLKIELLDLEGFKACQESKSLAEVLNFYSLNRKPQFKFAFYRWQAPLVREAVALFSKRPAQEPATERADLPHGQPMAAVVA